MSVITFTQSGSGTATTLQDAYVVSSKVEGVESTPTLEVSALQLTRRDGRKVISTTYATRQIMVEGTLTESTSSAMRTRLDNLKRDVSGGGTLDVTLDGDSLKRYQVQVINVLVPSNHWQLTQVPVSIQFEAFDPPFGESTSTSTVYSVSGNSANIAQTSILTGTAPPNLNLQVTVNTIGNLAAIEFRNDTTNTSFEVEPTAFVAGDILNYSTGEGILAMNGMSQDFTGVLTRFVPGTNNWAINYRSTSAAIDVQQTSYNSDKFAFGNSYLAQSFQATGAISVSRIDLLLSKLGSPTQVQVQIRTDNAGAPSTTVLTGSTVTVASSAVNVLPTYVVFNLSSLVALSAATKYWLVVSATGAVSDINNGFYWKGSNASPYASQNASRSADAATTWAADTAFDHSFKIFKTPLVASNTDTATETYSETFATTTNKDGGTTTADWNTDQGQLRYVASGTTVPIQQSNGSTEFGVLQDSDHRRHAQSFQETISYVVTEWKLGLYKVNSPTKTLKVEIYSDSGGVPGTLLTTSTTVAASGLTGSFADTTFTFTGGYLLQANTKYWFVLTATDTTLDATNYVVVKAVGTDDYANGEHKVEGSSFTGTGGDMYFKMTVNTYNSALNLGQSIALSGDDEAYIAQATLTATQILVSGSSVAYKIQSNATTGLETVTNGVENTFVMPSIGTPARHKWNATLSGGTDRSIPVVDAISIAYRRAMPVFNTTDRLAQSFTPTANASLASVDLNIAKTVSDTIDYTIEIQTDSAGSPSGTVVTNGTATIAAATVPLISSGFSWVTATFGTAPSLTASTKYWIVVKVGTAGSSKLLWRARGGNSYASETAKASSNSGSAYTTLTDNDFLFRALSGANTFSNTVSVTYKARWL